MQYLQPKRLHEADYYIPLSPNKNSSVKKSSLDNLHNGPITYQNIDYRLKLGKNAPIDPMGNLGLPSGKPKPRASFKKPLPNDEMLFKKLTRNYIAENKIDPVSNLVRDVVRNITNQRKLVLRDIDFFTENNRPSEKFFAEINEKLSNSINGKLNELVERDYLKEISTDGRHYIVAQGKSTDNMFKEEPKFIDMKALRHTHMFTRILNQEYPDKNQYILEVYPQMKENQLTKKTL